MLQFFWRISFEIRQICVLRSGKIYITIGNVVSCAQESVGASDETVKFGGKANGRFFCSSVKGRLRF